VSLAEPRGEDAVLGDIVGDDGANDPALSPRNDDDAAQLRRACRALTPRLRRVLELRFGLDGGAGCTLRQVADELGVSRERARHLAASALGQLAGRTQVKALRAA
jgi:RNA polymerase sigma factor (sigma-70 family)